MLIFSILCLLLNISPVVQIQDAACNELVHAVADYETGIKTFKNKYRIPVVDKNGKMMFDINLEKRGAINSLLLTPARDCRFHSEYDVTFEMVNGTTRRIRCQHAVGQEAVRINIDNELLSEIMTERLLSISFAGMKYDYDLVLKPNQSLVIQDVINCIQR